MASISDAEFERLQNQLLELKNSNYTLEERCRKQSVDALQLKERCETLEKDLALSKNLAKLNPLAFAKTFQLNKGQKEKELIDSLNDEKEFYQKKCQSQEDEFKLTNSTLRQEIASLMHEIEVLNNENIKLRTKVPEIDLSDSSSNRCNSSHSDSDGEITLQLKSNSQRKTELSYAILSEKEQLENSLDDVTNNLKSIKDENQILHNKVNELSNQNLRRDHTIKKLKETNICYLNEMNTLKVEIDSTKKEIVNFKELAEKRKSTIDEMKCYIEDTSGKAELAIESANKKVNEIRSSLNKELSLLKVEKKDLMSKTEELQKQLDAITEQSSEYEVQCTKLREEIEQLKKQVDELNCQLADHEANKLLIEKLEDEKQRIVVQLHDENELKVKELNQLNEKLREQLSQKESLIKKLRQDVEDQIEDRKIHEKKGLMIVRELKKQLNNEKKMKERLQEKFGELQSEKSFDLSSKNFDTTSVGSWSWLSSAKDPNVSGRNNSTYSIHSSTDGNTNGINSPVSDMNSPMPNGFSHNQVLEKENTELVTRLTKLQQEKWTLEEKMNNILLTIEKLESELEVKQKVIAFYCMDRRTEPIKQATGDKFKVKNLVIDFVKDKSDNLKEINRKLQRMLEEMLTKNMHLQNNLELISNELESLKTKNAS